MLKLDDERIDRPIYEDQSISRSDGLIERFHATSCKQLQQSRARRWLSDRKCGLSLPQMRLMMFPFPSLCQNLTPLEDLSPARCSEWSRHNGRPSYQAIGVGCLSNDLPLLTRGLSASGVVPIFDVRTPDYFGLRLGEFVSPREHEELK